MGSSPLTRGKRADRRANTRRQGLIPAHAGKTWNVGTVPDREGAHPRSRGENLGVSGEGIAETGSSPLTRGKLDGAGPVGVGLGLIPAHAGKTVGTLRGGAAAAGSSPLTRGKRPGRDCRQDLQGLIPAHAGKTGQFRRDHALQRAHPRSRGENPTLLITTPHVQGSSPLTRGKLVPALLQLLGEGLIPAHAGKTG